MGGEKVDLQDDGEILKINSPRGRVGGPYVVVHKDTEDRYAIVAMHWDEAPRLGIRWFWDETGHPSSSAHPTWFAIPSSLSKGILRTLPLDHQFSSKVDDFLSGKQVKW